MRIIYYYQSTTIDLMQILGPNPVVTHIYISSIHFNLHHDGNKKIYLNDTHPDDPMYNTMWAQIHLAAQMGIKIMLMIGGAGGAYTTLFNDFEEYYGLLRGMVTAHPEITGFDLDVEEIVELDNVKMLIRRIRQDYPEYIISMAPVQRSLQTNLVGLGGFIYKDLWNSPEGQLIDYFNCQFYDDYSMRSFEECIKNGYPANKIVMGMMASQYSGGLDWAYDVIRQVKQKYPTMGGVFNWEYFDTLPNPKIWSEQMHHAMKSNDDNLQRCRLF